jgi:predicted nucleotidyltransferase
LAEWRRRSPRDTIRKNVISRRRSRGSSTLYGSYARGAAKDWSDIDLAIISPDFIGDMFEERLELMRLAVSMDERIEPHPFRPEEFNDNQPLASEIRRTGIAIDIQTSPILPRTGPSLVSSC